MSKRNDKGQYRTRYSKKTLLGTWTVAILSSGLLYVIASYLYTAFASFKSCSANDAGTALSSCGKTALNVGDILLIMLMFASAALAASMFSAAYRMTFKKKLI